MNYQKIYDSIITRAQKRPILEGEYTERHHILPKSLGGSNRKANIVRLYPREHFVCHVLLHKLHGGKMTYTLYMMSKRKQYNSKSYETARIAALETLQSKDRCEKIAKALTGMKKSAAHIQNWKESRAAGGGWNCTEERKILLQSEMKGEGNPMFGKTHTSAARDKIKEANKQKSTCIHCGKEGGIAIMKRWHFDNCKQSPQKRSAA